MVSANHPGHRHPDRNDLGELSLRVTESGR